MRRIVYILAISEQIESAVLLRRLATRADPVLKMRALMKESLSSWLITLGRCEAC